MPLGVKQATEVGDVYLYLKHKELSVFGRGISLFCTARFLKRIAFLLYLSLLLFKRFELKNFF